MYARRSRTRSRKRSTRLESTGSTGEETNIMSEPVDVQTIVQQAVDEYMRQDVARREPAYKTELHEERRRREQLEKRVNELVEENKRSRAVADEAQRSTNIRTELQKLGVVKVDLASRAVQAGIGATD